VLNQKDNDVIVIAQSAAIAQSREMAYLELEKINLSLQEVNRQMEKEFAFSESELKRSIKASKSGEFM